MISRTVDKLLRPASLKLSITHSLPVTGSAVDQKTSLQLRGLRSLSSPRSLLIISPTDDCREDRRRRAEREGSRMARRVVCLSIGPARPLQLGPSTYGSARTVSACLRPFEVGALTMPNVIVAVDRIRRSQPSSSTAWDTQDWNSIWIRRSTINARLQRGQMLTDRRRRRRRSGKATPVIPESVAPPPASEFRR